MPCWKTTNGTRWYIIQNWSRRAQPSINAFQLNDIYLYDLYCVVDRTWPVQRDFFEDDVTVPIIPIPIRYQSNWGSRKCREEGQRNPVSETRPSRLVASHWPFKDERVTRSVSQFFTHNNLILIIYFAPHNKAIVTAWVLLCCLLGFVGLVSLKMELLCCSSISCCKWILGSLLVASTSLQFKLAIR